MRKTALLLIMLLSSMMMKAQSLPLEELQKKEPLVAQYYLGCKALNAYLKSKNTESLEDALVKLNPKVLTVETFTPDEVVDDSGLCTEGGHFVYDYEYALAVYEEREIPRELGLQRGETSNCKVSLLTLQPKGKVTYRVEACDNMVMLTVCEPGKSVSLNVTETADGKEHIGQPYDDNTVSYASWVMDDGMLEITITNNSESITSLAFITN